MALQAGRKGVNPAEVNNRGFLRNVLRAMKIKIAGTAVTPGSDGYVNIPAATQSNLGVVLISYAYGFDIGANGLLQGRTKTVEEYLSSNNSMVIAKGTLENVKYNIIKSVITDTTTNTWTDTERLAALSRLGCSVDSETGAVTWTAQS